MMKFLAWYSAILVTISCLQLLHQVSYYAYIDTASVIGLFLFSPIVFYLWKLIKDKKFN